MILDICPLEADPQNPASGYYQFAKEKPTEFTIKSKSVTLTGKWPSSSEDEKQQMQSITTQVLKGKELAAHLSELTQLRLIVFREYPYLYEGDPAFENHYLSLFINAKDAFLIIAKDGEAVIGAISGIPLDYAQKEIKDAFIHHSMGTTQIYALCEILILKEYRGHKIGSRLYREFESQVKKLPAYKKIVLWQGIKPQDDPKKPSDYFSLDFFWEKNHFVKRPDLHCDLYWKEIGEDRETPKAFEFFMKKI